MEGSPPGGFRGLPADALVVAKAGRPHGVRGEIRLMPESGDPERLLGLTRAWIVAPGDGSTGAPRELVIASSRPHQGVTLVRFEGIASPEAAAALTHGDVWASLAELPERGGDAFGVDEVVGATLYDGDAPVGQVVGVSSGGGRDFFEVEISGRRELIPAVKDWLVEFDRHGRRIVMRLPQGLLEQ